MIAAGDEERGRKDTRPRQRTPWSGIGKPVLLVATVLVLASCSRDATTGEETAHGPVPVAVAVAPVSAATVERGTEVVGSLFANEEVTIASQLEARIEWLGADMGDRIRAGDVILRLDDADLRAGLREVEASLAKARADEARGRALRREGIISVEEVEKLRTDAAVLAARREVLTVKLGRAVIRSPLTGSVADKLVSAGEVVKIGAPLFRIVEDDPLKFRSPIPERFAAVLHIGQEVRLHFDAYRDETFVGKVTRINPTSDAASRSIVIEALVPNPDARLKPGFFANGDIVYDIQATTLAVPESALTSFAGLTKLYVVEDGKAEERVVRTGIAIDGARREIVEGVEAGEQVAVTNVDQLEQGVPVTIDDAAPVAGSTR